MDASDLEPAAVAKWDPELTERLMGLIRPVIKGWHRAEVRGLEDFPTGGALVVANHSGGLFAMDVPVFATDFYATFGYDRPVYTLSHDILFADFDGRTGYIRAALNAGVPIVPSVSIGGQENQLFLTRGEWLAKVVRIDKLMRTKFLPLSFGFPFGLSMVLPVNLPLPTKIVTQVLAPIDVVAEFGEDPDVEEVDAYVRSVMQQGLDDLAAQRRFPVIG
jgi:1-acyl-sn-glycerol-3-phosphate acyltransferase